ncbi:MAG: FAD-dependent oxidoreductase [Clostridiales bacterium]|nr:FAD-dependent oxidoreductase [Clostridiales bacterium]
MKSIKINADLCVIGGGMSGICVAISAARKGVKVVLIHDRNVLGGNASSEIRMWPRGAGRYFPEYSEGGLIEEIALDNMHYNPEMNYSLFDAVLYNKVVSEKNIKLLLGTTCIGAKCEDGKIKYVKAWQLASYNSFIVHANYFADCSGDCILSEFTNALTMQGRESKDDYGEPHAKAVRDNKTMGNSCLFKLRKTDKQVSNNPFPFETKPDPTSLNKRVNFNTTDYTCQNFWWLELGGNKDALKNADQLNHDLISLAFGTYSEMVKQTQGKSGWKLDWVGFLAGKRETRRYVGDYVLNENDVINATPFDDEIAYGGWGLDDHNPDGFYGTEANVNTVLNAPYPIPYRSVYSKNIDNLFFAGRNISVTHLALSSTRVILTCCAIGQGVGNAVAIAKKYGISAREVGQKHIDELKQEILFDDLMLLSTKRNQTINFSNGIERDLNGEQNGVVLDLGQELSFTTKKTFCKYVRLVFDSDFLRKETSHPALKNFPLSNYNSLDEISVKTPSSLVKDFTIKVKCDGAVKTINVKDNFQRLVLIPINADVEELTFCAEKTHGAQKAKIFSIDITK